MPQSLYERVFDGTAARLAVHEPGTDRFDRVNPAYADALGYDPSALDGRRLTDLVEGDATEVDTAIERALDGDAERVPTSVTGGDGETRRVRFEFDVLTEGTGTRLISRLRSADERVASTPSERRLELALAGTDTGVWEWDMATDEVVWTESMERLFGVDPGTFEAFADRVHPDDLPAVQSAIEAAIEDGEMFQTEYRIERDDGAERWVHARGELGETAGGADRIVGIVTDITDRKRTERTLRRREQQYRQLVERLPQAHYVVDADWRVTFCNETLADRLGRTVDEVEGERLWDLLPAAKGSVVERMFRRVMETGEPQHFEYQYAFGDHVVSVQAYPYDDGIAAVSTDITDQQEALLSILDATPVILYRFDADGVFREVRGQMLSKLGLEPEDLLGKSIFEVYADVEKVTAAARRALQGESFRYTLSLGDTTLETHYKPVYTDGEVTGVIGVSMDVTELQRQRERMEFFNSILRHDVLNGMTVIKMRAELLADELDGDLGQYAQTILDWCTTTTEVTKRVRQVIETLATPDEEHSLDSVDALAILDRKLRELSTAYPEVTFRRSIPADVRVRADELLADVLGNVLTNSLEHNDTDGLTVETTVDARGDTVRISIEDDGVGVADDRKESIFRRGETSHAKETGSGFGLFFVDVMIEKYGGEIRVEDGEDGGARFVIDLDADGEPTGEER